MSRTAIVILLACVWIVLLIRCCQIDKLEIRVKALEKQQIESHD